MSTHAETESVELPHVAVIIATHNYGKWLLEAITSVILQDYPNKSIWICDDGSTDETAEIMESLLDKKIERVIEEGNTIGGDISGYIQNVKIHYRLQKQCGPSTARNRILKEAVNEAQLFAILDADDYWQPEKLSKSVAKFLEHPEIFGAVYTDNYTINEQTGITSREFRESFDYNRLLQHNMVHSGCVISKKALQTVGVYDEEMRVAEDYDLWLRIAERFMIYHIPEPLVTIRAGNHNTSNSVPHEVWEQNWKRVYQKVQQRAQRNTN